MPLCTLSRLLQRRSSASQASNPKVPRSQDTIRTVKFDPHIQYRAPSSKSQGIDMQNLRDILTQPRSGPSRRRRRDIPHSQKSRRDLRRPSQTPHDSKVRPTQSLRNTIFEVQGNLSGVSPNPYTLIESPPMHNPHAFMRGMNDPPTPWARVVPPLRESPFQPPTTTYLWAPTGHISQVYHATTPNLGIPGISTAQAPPFQAPFFSATPSPIAQMNSVQPQASMNWTPQVSIAPTPQMENTPSVTYFCTAGITQPQTNPPPNFFIAPTPIPKVIPPTNPPTMAHQFGPGVPATPAWQKNQVEPSVIPPAGITYAQAIPTTWGGQLRSPSTPMVTPTSQKMSSHSSPVAFPSGELLTPGGERGTVPQFAPAVQTRFSRQVQNQTVSPGEPIRVNGLRNNPGGDHIDTLLSNGHLSWDIRLFPAMSRFHPARPYVPNLDLPALSDEIEIALIEFENPRLRVFTALWGAIHVPRSRPSIDGSVSSISVRDLMEAIYQYFLEPITREDQSRFIWTPQQQEEFDLMFASRISLQGRLEDQPRRFDLLADNLVNFRKIVVERAEGSMVRLRLTLS